MFNSSFMKPFPSPSKWLTMCVNFLDECVLLSSLYFVCSFVCYFKRIPHLLHRLTSWYPVKFVKSNRRYYSVSSSYIILCSFVFIWRPLMYYFWCGSLCKASPLEYKGRLILHPKLQSLGFVEKIPFSPSRRGSYHLQREVVSWLKLLPCTFDFERTS